MQSCVVPNCKNHPGLGFNLIPFPQDIYLREAWKNAVNKHRHVEWEPFAQYWICEVHFKKTDWREYKCTVKKNVVPSVFYNNKSVEELLAENRALREAIEESARVLAFQELLLSHIKNN